MSDLVETQARPSTAILLIRTLRPEQWTKNLVLFAALLFGLRLFDPIAVFRAGIAFVLFCLLSGVVYIVNDVRDRHSDREHPLKSRRPIASGALAPGTALAAASVIGAGALAASFALDLQFGVVAVGYVLLQALYSMALKHVVILDVLSIAIGFVLRAVAGALAIEVPISMWLLLCTVLLAAFLGLSKRRHELTLLAASASNHRRALDEYSPYLLDQMISVVTASTLMAYAFYTVSEETVAKFGTELLALTIPFPLYGIFRYLYLVHQRQGGGSPSAMLLTDRPLLVCVALWALAVMLIIYHPFG
ncbi:MAG TPA: decaprenyl-phosphate phosphoribosyltransferase [Vicinamibacterales bacterium]